MKMTLNGMEDAVKQMDRIERNTAKMQNYRVFVGSKLPYAYGQEMGRHRVSGKLARRSGGTFYLQGAVETVLSSADKDISEGLDKVTSPGVWVLKRLGLWARRLARVNVPRSRGVKGKSKRHNYRLWRSINIDIRK